MNISPDIFFGNIGQNVPMGISGLMLGFKTKLSCYQQEFAYHVKEVDYHHPKPGFYCYKDGKASLISEAKYSILRDAFEKQNQIRDFFFGSCAENILPSCREAAFQNNRTKLGAGYFVIEIHEDKVGVEYDTARMEFSASIIKRGFRYPNAFAIYSAVAHEVCIRTSIFKNWVYSSKDTVCVFLKAYNGQNISELLSHAAVSSSARNTPMDLNKKITVSYETGYYPRSSVSYDNETVFFKGVAVFHHNADSQGSTMLRGRIEKVRCNTAEECAALCQKMAQRSY